MTEDYPDLQDQRSTNMVIGEVNEFPVIIGYSSYYCIKIHDKIVVFTPQPRSASKRHINRITEEAEKHGFNPVKVEVERPPKAYADDISRLLTEEIMRQLPDELREKLTAKII